jgi:hypothetical protein
MFHIVILDGILAASYGVLPDRNPRAFIRPKKPATIRPSGCSLRNSVHSSRNRRFSIGTFRWAKC